MNKSKDKWLTTLETSGLFRGLSMDEIKILAASMFYAEFDNGQALVYEQEPGNELFIIVRGEVAVSVKANEEKEIELARLQTGAFFGEMAMLEQELRSATCRAVNEVSCLVLKSKDFNHLIIAHPKIASCVLNNMLKITSNRLLEMDSLLSQIVQWGDDAKKRAITDSFTGLYNRRYLEESFETLIKQSLREHQQVSFAMVDVDRFGELNKTYGTAFCDQILLAITDTFKKCFDSRDILIRYGGDEFCFIIIGSLERAEQQCKNTCQKVNELAFETHPDLKVSCSIGLVKYNLKMSTDRLLKCADLALYEAKENGRNQTVVFAEHQI